jgi:hypothetical protein
MRLVCPAAVCRPICMGHAWSLDAAAWTGVILRRRCSVSGFRECAPGCAATPLGASTAACAVQAHTPLKCTGVPGERLAGGGDGTAVQLARAHAHDVPAAMQIQESCRPQHERARLNTTCKLGIAAPAASGGVCVWEGGAGGAALHRLRCSHMWQVPGTARARHRMHDSRDIKTRLRSNWGPHQARQVRPRTQQGTSAPAAAPCWAKASIARLYCKA